MVQNDWHPADILNELKKKGTTLSAVSRKAGLASTTLANALRRAWPKGEKLIAAELGLNPADIWPSRYVEKHITERRYVMDEMEKDNLDDILVKRKLVDCLHQTIQHQNEMTPNQTTKFLGCEQTNEYALGKVFTLSL